MNWVELFVATFSASLIGSMHCVGMCGPFTMMATHSSNRNISGSDKLPGVIQPQSLYLTNMKMLSYHFGRLSTYLFLGVLAGSASSMLNQVGDSAGWAEIAAKLAGLLMIGFGVTRLILLSKPSRVVKHSASMESWTKGILRIGKGLQARSPFQRAFVMGLITTWLPCGWLYLFALASSSTGSVGGATWMMFAFWVGTLPLLSLVAIGGQSLQSKRLVDKLSHVPVIGNLTRVPLQGAIAAMMIGFGLYTTIYRSQISLKGMSSPVHAGELNPSNISKLVDQPLPCCEHCLKKGLQAENSKVKSKVTSVQADETPSNGELP